MVDEVGAKRVLGKTAVETKPAELLPLLAKDIEAFKPTGIVVILSRRTTENGQHFLQYQRYRAGVYHDEELADLIYAQAANIRRNMDE